MGPMQELVHKKYNPAYLTPKIKLTQFFKIKKHYSVEKMWFLKNS